MKIIIKIWYNWLIEKNGEMMSTQMNQYLGYGSSLPYNETNVLLENKYTEDGKEEMLDKYHDSAFEEIVEIDGCSMIVDGMNGKYIFFGKILKKSTVYQPLNTMEIPKISSKIKKNVIEQHNKIFDVENKKPQMILLSHYR